MTEMTVVTVATRQRIVQRHLPGVMGYPRAQDSEPRVSGASTAPDVAITLDLSRHVTAVISSRQHE